MSTFLTGPSLWFRGKSVRQVSLPYSNTEISLELLETEFLFVLAMET